MQRTDVAAVILAAGLGTRFRSERAKVLHPLAGRPMLWHLLQALRPLGLGQVVVVVGHQADEVVEVATTADVPGVTTVLQREQRGTADATEHGVGALDEGIEHVLVLAGDTPLLSTDTLEALLADTAEAPATLLSADVDDPTGYGRVLRDDAGRVVGIVEERDATDAQRALREVNTSIYRFQRAPLEACLPRVTTDNTQSERYLTDVIGLLVSDGARVDVVRADAIEVAGVNDRAQLGAAAAVVRARTLDALMTAGVTVIDPATTYVDVGVEIGVDTTLLPGCVLEGETTIGAGATVGPWTRLTDATIGDGATIAQSVVLGATVGPDCTVGPFAYLRPGARLERGAKAGTFVEIKQSQLGEGAKVPHLTYVGDATIGKRSNVGAGTVTVNYDGRDKHPTRIGDDAFIGSGSMLVAPVTIGDGAYVAGGSTITEDVPDGALGIGRARQVNKDDWARGRDRGHERNGDGEQPPQDEG